MFKYQAAAYFLYNKFKDKMFFTSEAEEVCPFRLNGANLYSLQRNKLLKIVAQKRAKRARPKYWHHMRNFWEFTPKGIEFAKKLTKADMAKYFLKKKR